MLDPEEQKRLLAVLDTIFPFDATKKAEAIADLKAYWAAPPPPKILASFDNCFGPEAPPAEYKWFDGPGLHPSPEGVEAVVEIMEKAREAAHYAASAEPTRSFSNLHDPLATARPTGEGRRLAAEWEWVSACKLPEVLRLCACGRETAVAHLVGCFATIYCVECAELKGVFEPAPVALQKCGYCDRDAAKGKPHDHSPRPNPVREVIGCIHGVDLLTPGARCDACEIQRGQKPTPVPAAPPVESAPLPVSTSIAAAFVDANRKQNEAANNLSTLMRALAAEKHAAQWKALAKRYRAKRAIAVESARYWLRSYRQAQSDRHADVASRDAEIAFLKAELAATDPSWSADLKRAPPPPPEQASMPAHVCACPCGKAFHTPGEMMRPAPVTPPEAPKGETAPCAECANFRRMLVDERAEIVRLRDALRGGRP